MTIEVTFDGTNINIADPAQYLEALLKVEFKLLSGEQEVKLKFGDNETTFQETSLPRVQKRIAELRSEIDRAGGKRTRFAARVNGI